MEDKAKDKRIAIIGAGAAGLTAAEALKEKGYKEVVLFEKSDHVGGKCSTAEIDSRLYELGAGIVAANNKSVLKLVKKFDVPIVRANFGKSILVDGVSGEVVSKRSVRHKLKISKEVLLRYRKILKKHKRIVMPGFSELGEDLALPFVDFAKKYRVEELSRELELFFTGYGYGYFSEVPAAYVLKYFNWDTVKSFAKRTIYTFPNGIQHLWTTVAKNHEVRLNASIKKITRNNNIVIKTAKESLEFDVLIVASPLDETLDYLDVNKEEEKQFSKIQFVDYRTIACSVQGLDNVSGYVPSNFSSSRAGHPVFWYFRHEGSNVYMFYVLAEPNQSDDDVVANTKDLIEKIGGKLNEVERVAHWKYFPHVSSKEMESGYYDKVEGMQGRQGTYYIGELMNFSTVGLTSEYAEDLVDRFF
jgi:predicted NAD/FAD-dependent oxidoreductase